MTIFLIAFAVLLIIGTSTLFTYVMAMEGISRQISQVILGISSNPVIVLLAINILLLVLGMIMEPGAILTLMLPVLLPIANGLGLNLVHFGVMIVLNLMIGQVTPPFGVCLFAKRGDGFFAYAAAGNVYNSNKRLVVARVFYYA